jgi:hypothetical protein
MPFISDNQVLEREERSERHSLCLWEGNICGREHPTSQGKLRKLRIGRIFARDGEGLRLGSSFPTERIIIRTSIASEGKLSEGCLFPTSLTCDPPIAGEYRHSALTWTHRHLFD